MPKCASTVPTMSDATATLISVEKRRASMPCRRFRRLIRPIAIIAVKRTGPRIPAGRESRAQTLGSGFQKGTSGEELLLPRGRHSLRIIAVKPVDYGAHRVPGFAVAHRVKQ